VLLTSNGSYVLHIITHPSSIIISWLPIYHCIRTRCLELCHPPIMSCPVSQKMDVVSNTYYNCGHVGHIIRDCPAPRQNSAPCPWSHCNHPHCGPTKVVAIRNGRVNYTTFDDVPEGKQVLVGTIFFEWTPSHHSI
jgi:hypothetical protein